MNRRLPIIALSGKIGSGKDLTAAMIQRVFLEEKVEQGQLSAQSIPSLESLTKPQSIPYHRMHSMYEVQRFAYKLKAFVASIIGVPVWKLDDQDFKKSILGPEWAYFTPENESYLSGKMFPGTWSKKNMTVREMLIRIGDGMRNAVHPDIWVNALFSDYKEDCNWVIADMRYENEKNRIEKLAGVSIRINRKDCVLIDHISETGLDNEGFSYVINNNGSLQELYDQIKAIVNDIRTTKRVY